MSLITEEPEAAPPEEVAAPQAEEVEAIPAADKGVYAIAMYDYEAGEDNEISKPNSHGLYFRRPSMRANHDCHCSFSRGRRGD